MQTIDTSTLVINKDSIPIKLETDDRSVPNTASTNSERLIFRLGLWFSGLESFLNLYSSDLVKENYLSHDWSREFRLTRSVLQLCSKLTLDFLQKLATKNSSVFKGKKFELLDESDLGYAVFSEEKILALSLALKESILFSDAVLRSESMGFQDWTVWSKSLLGKLKGIEVVQKLIGEAEREGGEFLPEIVKALLDKDGIEPQLLSDLKIVMPQFAKMLKWLSVVERMLKEDKPLKPTLLIFAKINEQMSDMMDYINNRLLRYPNEEDAFFGSLDSAAYTSSIELRKVYNQELKELIEIRPAPVVFAKIENSFALLHNSLQLTIVNFAKLIDPDLLASNLFTNLKKKEEQSVILRDEMWRVLQLIKEAEKEPENYLLRTLNEQLVKFGDLSAGMLFYKDVETVKRFIEEVLRTKENKDIVPTLHRFGAYLETLLGQVNMRVALADHPFAPLDRDSNEMFA